MEFILLFAISLIPFFSSISILYFFKNTLTIALSVFLLLLSFWQMDIAFLYGDGLFEVETINILFRIFRIGPIFIMPILYFFAYYILKQNKLSKFFRIFINKVFLIILFIFSTFVYIINFTDLGFTSYVSSGGGFLSPSHLMPVYGYLNIIFQINVAFVFINTIFLLAITLKVKDPYYKNFYIKLVCTGAIIFLNGAISAFTKIPLYSSSFNSILATIVLFLGFFQMQAQRVKAINQVLSRQSNLLETIMNINPNYILVKNIENKVIMINESLCQLLHSHSEQLIGTTLVESNIQKVLVSSKYPGIKKYIDPEGAEHLIHWESHSLNALHEDSLKLYFGIDVTEQKKNEQLLLTSEKMKVIGEMAASIAHEIRNPLTTIRGFIQLMLEKNSDSQYEKILLEEIDRINQVLKELLLLAKPEAKKKQEHEKGKINLIYEIQNIYILFEALALEQNKIIILDIRYNDSFPVCIGKDHFKQILINVIQNSFEAIPTRGKIKIIIDKYKERARIRVIDNGVGISKQRLSRIGEPYYTSKEKGTGIGLTICYKIIKENNGEILIKSKEKVGTVISIIIPLENGEK